MGSKQEDLKTTSKSPCEGRCGIEWVGVRCQSGQNRSRKMGEEMLCCCTTSYKFSSTLWLSPSFIPSLRFQCFLVLRTVYSSHAQTSTHHIPSDELPRTEIPGILNLLPKHHAPDFRFPLYFDPDPLTHRKAPITPPTTLLATSPTNPAFSAIGG